MSTHFTPTEQRILKLLSDGVMHTRDELKSCLWDELAEDKALSMHLSRIRVKIRPKGQDVILRMVNGASYYLHVRVLPTSTE